LLSHLPAPFLIDTLLSPEEQVQVLSVH
jgi:hypothetical protein